MCQMCIQKSLEISARAEALKEECMALASAASQTYADAGSIGAATVVALLIPNSYLTESQVARIVLGVRTAAHLVNEADKIIGEFFTRSMELGLLKGVQEALMASTFEMNAHSAKPETTH